MWPFRRRPSRQETTLADAILKEGIERRKIDAEIVAKQRDLEMRRMELEMEHIEALGEERRKDAREKQAIREQRQAHAASMRETRKKQLLAQSQQQQPDGRRSDCPVCVEPGRIDHAPSVVAWHARQHWGAPSDPINWN